MGASLENIMRASAGIFLSLLLSSCNEPSTGPGPMSPPKTTATTSTTSAPVPTTSSSTTSAPSNRPPVVTLTGGSCHPSAAGSRVGARSCTVRLAAQASDPDGDDLEILWSGCGSGLDLIADCVITSPGALSARIEVRDGRGGAAAAVAQAVGINGAPDIRFGGPRPPDPAPPNTPYTLVGSQPTDPDGDEDENILCSRTSVTASGACTVGLAFLCGGVSDGFDVDVRTLAGPGTCVLEARSEDSWGADGTDRLTFRVQ